MLSKRSATGLLSVCLMISSVGAPSLVVANVGTDSVQQQIERQAVREEAFPFPKELESNVAFWRQVYSSWDLDQVALHDMRHMHLVYDVLTIPGDVKEGLTTEQRQWVRQRKDEFAARLARITRMNSTPDLLSNDDRQLRDHIIKVAGNGAIYEAEENLRSQRGLKTRFHKGLEASGRYDRVFRQIFRDAGLPEDLAYLPHVESSFQNHARSSVGASGMWQFMRATGREYMNINKAVDERLDPVVSAHAAARYLANAHAVLDDWALALTSYNHGVGGMMRARERFGHDFGRVVREYDGKTFGFASRNFYAQFLAARQIAKDDERFFPEGVRYERPLDLDFVVLNRSQNVVELANRFNLSHQELADLNPAWNRAAIKNQAPLPRGSRVWLPNGALAGNPQRSEPIALREDEAAALSRVVEKKTVAKVRDAGLYYVVKKNDSLSTIANRHKMSVAQLRELNGFEKDKVLLRIGQKLRIKRAEKEEVQVANNKERNENKTIEDAVYHVVRAGDSPYLIASNYGVSLKTLMKTNQLTKRSILRPGQRLMIPTM